ncbi:MAG TPA: hypothetical protein VFJ67_03705 [Thermodesulfobacteriota bacterium]|nr:hypothetical protein [Thermodesulfobacteriota bacterium]
MKGFNLFMLLAVLFLSDFALAQIPSCPCDTTELPSGVSGIEIIETLCPGGELADDAGSNVTQETVQIFTLEPGGASYGTFTDGSNLGCSISDGNIALLRSVTEQEFEDCNERLIEGCDLLTRSIPTLSQWSMMATAGVLGLIGLIYTLRRKTAA